MKSKYDMVPNLINHGFGCHSASEASAQGRQDGVNIEDALKWIKQACKPRSVLQLEAEIVV